MPCSFCRVALVGTERRLQFCEFVFNSGEIADPLKYLYVQIIRIRTISLKTPLAPKCPTSCTLVERKLAARERR